MAGRFSWSAPLRTNWVVLNNWSAALGRKAVFFISAISTVIVFFENKIILQTELSRPLIGDLVFIFFGALIFCAGMLAVVIRRPIEFNVKDFDLNVEIQNSQKAIVDFELFSARRVMFENIITRFEKMNSIWIDQDVFSIAKRRLISIQAATEKNWSNEIPGLESSFFKLRSYDRGRSRLFVLVLFLGGTSIMLYKAVLRVISAILYIAGGGAV